MVEEADFLMGAGVGGGGCLVVVVVVLVLSDKFQQSKVSELKVHPIHFIDRVRAFRCAQRRVPTVQIVQQTVEIPQLQFLDKVVVLPVVLQGSVPESAENRGDSARVLGQG